MNLIGIKNNLLYDYPVTKKNAVIFQKRKEGEKISILYDKMLKAMFQHEDRLKYSCKFISYFLDISYENLLKHLSLMKNELDRDYIDDRAQHVDYVARINDTIIGIEVNNNSSADVMERNVEYANRLYSTKIIKKEKGYQYNQVIQFNLNNFAFIGNDEIIDIYANQNKNGIWLNNKIIIIQIYIPNLRKKWYDVGMEGLDEKERYILSLVEPSIDDSKELGSGNIIVEDYIEESKNVIYMDIGESYDKEQALLEESKKDGLIEGTQKTIAKFVTNMLKHKEPLEKISEYTGLSIDEINKIKEEND